jgi:hypothetical protein
MFDDTGGYQVSQPKLIREVVALVEGRLLSIYDGVTRTWRWDDFHR